MKHKVKKIIGILTAIILIIAVYFIVFDKLGWFLTIKSHGFLKLKEHIYVDNDYNLPVNDILKILEETNIRLTGFWGILKSEPILIISDDETKLNRMGWNGNPAFTTTYTFFGAHSYVLISPEGLTTDILSHELSHAELHARLVKNKILSFHLPVPAWFDEGVAMQSDYREKYGRNSFNLLTNNERVSPELDSIETPNQFFNTDADTLKTHFMISKYEVEDWISLHGKEQLMTLIEEINFGKSFGRLYNLID